MGVLWSIVSVGLSMLFTPLLMMLLSVIFLASMGKSLGVRRLYIRLLLALFETDISRKKSFETLKREFEPAICLDYIRAGIESIIEDDVTSRFEAEELKMCFILLTTFSIGFLPSYKLKRWVNDITSRIFFRIMAAGLSAQIDIHNPEFKPKTGGICVANHTSTIDVCILSTDTTFSLVMWLTFCTAIVGYMPDSEFKRWLNQRVLIMCFAVLSSALSSVITYHNVENKPKTGICVANHTSPIDALVLMCHNCYSLIGQRHGGFLGILQRALARASPHIWFERSEIKDREAVAKRLKLHISDPKNPPILIFPEGTCINNTSVMQFKKGSFEVGGVIYPVAIKYDPRFGDAFWNSSKYSMIQYLYMMMSSWAIVCDVWYLPPMYRKEDESAIDFANRVKSVIARQGGLVDLQWDGQLKRMKPKKEWREKQQEEFSRRLKVE
ncbi:unnamed protein product [Trichogramma brassicae]|uniref:Phospholipid/glycerol acyltransferase domain-containing protein n=1 Tax=Trichogramma brassicae TaxID=86971 RepID=A0A6H5IVK0_9HYME|nr:unnamed protein product [Trichogramma brassicae]